MPDLRVTVLHQLTRAEARRRIALRLPQLHQQLSGALGRLEDRWQGDTLEFQVSSSRPAVAGQLIVEDHAVRLEVSLPWYLAPLSRNVVCELERAARHLLNGS